MKEQRPKPIPAARPWPCELWQVGDDSIGMKIIMPADVYTAWRPIFAKHKEQAVPGLDQLIIESEPIPVNNLFLIPADTTGKVTDQPQPFDGFIPRARLDVTFWVYDLELLCVIGGIALSAPLGVQGGAHGKEWEAFGDNLNSRNLALNLTPPYPLPEKRRPKPKTTPLPIRLPQHTANEIKTVGMSLADGKTGRRWEGIEGETAIRYTVEDWPLEALVWPASLEWWGQSPTQNDLRESVGKLGIDGYILYHILITLALARIIHECVAP